MRKLASIITIKELQPIEGKDRIKYISFEENEWRVIGSANLQPGVKVLYIEYDTILPLSFVDRLKKETAEMLKKRCFSPFYNGCKITAMKMAGRVSYGIMFDQTDLGDVFNSDEWKKYSDGRDLTERLGILRIDDIEPVSSAPQPKKSFFRRLFERMMYILFGKRFGKKNSGWLPFIGRTDETRVQALPHGLIEELRGTEVYATVKVDGQSATYAINKGRFYIASRNLVVYDEPLKKAIKDLVPVNIPKFQKYCNAFILSACKYSIPTMMNHHINTTPLNGLRLNNFAIQCEQAGPGIQKNPLGLESTQLFIFNVYDIDHRCYYSWDVIQWVSSTLNIPHVPFIANFTFEFNNIEELEEFAKGTYDNGKPREGVVIRAYKKGTAVMPSPIYSMSNMMSFKVINPDFILQQG